MGKHILILNGSPRKNGNSTVLVRAFAKGAERSGHTVTEFRLDLMNIHGCKGCYGGGKDPLSPCVQKDDMDQIYPVYRQADVVVFASPLYYWTISGQLKTAIDRLFAVTESMSDRKTPKKSAVLLMAATGNGFEESVYWYEHLIAHLGWTSLGKVLCGGVRLPGDINGNPALEEAERLGAAI